MRRLPMPASREFDSVARGAQFRDRIATVVKAPPDVIFNALRDVSLRDMKLAWALGEIRYLPSRLSGRMRAVDSKQPFLALLVEGGTLILADDSPREMITGSAAQLHRVNQSPRRFTTRESFDEFSDPDCEKLFMSVRVAPTGRPEEHWLVLEHATRALSPVAERRFSSYWRIIKPLGAFVSWLLLRAVRRKAERAAHATAPVRTRSATVGASVAETSQPLPGDELIPEPSALPHATQTTTWHQTRAESMPARTIGRTVMSVSESRPIHGSVSKGFEDVRDAFADNFARRRELGSGCCAYYQGEKVVDLWGGVRNKQTGEPWERDTMVIVYSATKGLAAMTMAIAHSRGWLDYERPVCEYWPEFAQQGKQRITVRQLLAHQAGLFVLDQPLDRSLVADFDRLAVVLARQKPAWEPGTRQAYHGITLGFYESELLRRIDPQHRSLGRFFQDEIASPLGLDVYISLPESIPDARLATITRPSWAELMHGFPLRLALDTMNRRSNICKSLRGSELPHEDQHVYARNLEVPSGGGVGTARAIAHAYSVFATGGRELGLRPETLELLAAPAVPPSRGFYDECMKIDGAQFSLGFMKSTPALPFGSASAFGSPGAGGALGFADPSAGVGYAYVTNRMGTRLSGDPRDVVLRNTLYSRLPVPSGMLGRVA